MKKLMKLAACIFIFVLLVPTVVCAETAGVIEVGTAETLKKAAEESACIKLTADITLDEWLTIASGTEITLDLNGFVLSYSNPDPGAISSVIKSDGKLTLIDSRPTAEHYFNDGNENESWTLTDDTAAPHKVCGGIITGGTLSGVYVTRNGSLTVEGGSIVGNVNNNTERWIGGGISCYSIDGLTMTGGTVCGNYDTYKGGGIFCQNTLTLSGGMITQNGAMTRGGGVSCSTLVMTGGSITDNHVKNTTAIVTWGSAQNAGEAFGGGVYCSNFKMTGGEISGNKTNGSTVGGNGPSYGGGVCCTDHAELSGGTITQNISGTGGGLCLGESGGSASATLTVGGSIRIIGNTNSGGKASNAYLHQQKLTIGTGVSGNGVAVPDQTAMKIGISSRLLPTASTSVQISNECDEDFSSCFVPDRSDIKVKYFDDSQTLKLIQAFTICIPDKTILQSISYYEYYDRYEASVLWPETGGLRVIIAHYDDRGALISYEMKAPIRVGSSKGTSFEITLTEHTKLFLLTYSTLLPHCEPATVTAN